MLHNRATIYSNGIADFQRIFPVKGGQANKISIPVRQQHLGDVLASLTISGAVRIESPPSYQPANQDDGNIRISAENALIHLATQLSGAHVEVRYGKSTTFGKLIGVHEHQVASGGHPVIEKNLVILSAEGISRVPINQLENLKFTEESIQSEIDKALNRQLRAIKPNSTFVDLELSTEQDATDAIIQYTIPAAAWKISYRILINPDGPLKFHGHAIVDNNTDEDWDDFMIAVVMGQPITFTTDLADSKTPRRSHVNIVQESALGAVEIADSMRELTAYSQEPQSAVVPESSAHFDQADHFPANYAKSRSRTVAAIVDEADVTETGDFCIFESASPASIAAHRSAVIPMFATTLDESNPVLHYKFENHAERPFRALRFKNSTEHSLGRGVCTVYDGTTYAGSCILPATKPGGDALLPHALETAVRVRSKPSKLKKRRVGIRISDGVAYESWHQLARTEYHITSAREQEFRFLLDHDNRLSQSEVEIQLNRDDSEPELLDSESLKSGRRIELALFGLDILVVTLIETSVMSARVKLTGTSFEQGKFQVGWLHDNLVASNSTLGDDPVVGRCVELQKLLDEINRKQSVALAEIERLSKRQDRLRKNIQTGSSDQQSARWQSDLGEAEDSIVKLEETILPTLLIEQEKARQELFDALKGLALEWNA